MGDRTEARVTSLPESSLRFGPQTPESVMHVNADLITRAAQVASSKDAFRNQRSNTAYRCGFRKRIPKGGSGRFSENGWPCAGTASAITPPALPWLLPP